MSNNLRLPVLAPPPPLESCVDVKDADLLQVGDLARESGKTVRAIHLYEELDLLKPAARSKGRYRLYTRDALVRIRWIGKLQDMGFSLTDIQSIVRDWERGGIAMDAMRKMRDVYASQARGDARAPAPARSARAGDRVEHRIPRHVRRLRPRAVALLLQSL